MLGELEEKARMTTETLNSIDGITCNEVMGAMYAFPQIHLPQKFIDEAKVNVLLLSRRGDALLWSRGRYFIME